MYCSRKGGRQRGKGWSKSFFLENKVVILDLSWHLATRMKFGTCEQNWDHFRALVPIGKKSQIWDLITGTEFAKQKKLRELNRQYLKGKRTVKFAFPGDSLGINKYPCSKGIEPPGLLDQECFFV